MVLRNGRNYSLYQVMRKYIEMGDENSAQVCREKLLRIPAMLDAVEKKTDELAWKQQHKPELELPEEYQVILQTLS